MEVEVVVASQFAVDGYVLRRTGLRSGQSAGTDRDDGGAGVQVTVERDKTVAQLKELVLCKLQERFGCSDPVAPDTVDALHLFNGMQLCGRVRPSCSLRWHLC